MVAFFDVADTHTNHSLARGKHQEGTGAWLLENKSFRAWVKTPKTLVWLHGIRECTKSFSSPCNDTNWIHKKLGAAKLY